MRLRIKIFWFPTKSTIRASSNNDFESVWTIDLMSLKWANLYSFRKYQPKHFSNSWVNERSVKYISRITFRNLVLHCYQRFPLNRKNIPFPPDTPSLSELSPPLNPPWSWYTCTYTLYIMIWYRYWLLISIYFHAFDKFNYFSCLVWDKRHESDGNQAWSQSFFWHKNTRASPVACYNITHLRPGTLF